MSEESVRVDTGVIIENGIIIKTKAASGGITKENKALQFTIGTTVYRIPIVNQDDNWELGAACHNCHYNCHSNCHGSSRGTRV